MKSSVDMTSGKIWKCLLQFFFPVAAGFLFQRLYNAADALIVGKFVGTQALASVGGSSTALANLLAGVFVSLACGSSVAIAQYFGAGNEDALRRAAGTAVTFCVLCGVPLTVLCELFRRPLLLLMNTPADAIDGSVSYLGIYFLTIVFMLLTNVESGILRSVGDSRTPFVYMLISCVSNVILDLLFVGVFGWAIRGVAWATLIAQVLNTVLVTLRLCRSKEPFRIDPAYFGIDRTVFRDMMRFGIPVALMSFLNYFSSTVIQSSINDFGSVAVASWTLDGKLHGIYDAIQLGMGSAVTTFAGQNFGAKQFDRIRSGYRTCLWLFFPAMALACGIVLWMAPWLLNFFTADEAVRTTTFTLLLYTVPFFLPGAMVELTGGVMRGCGEVRIPTAITAVINCAFRVAWVLAARYVFHDLYLVILAFGFSYILGGIVLTVYYLVWSRKALYSTCMKGPGVPKTISRS